VVHEIAAAAAEGDQALAEAGLRAARRLTGADGVTLLRWRDGYALVRARLGQGVQRLHRRPPEGAGHLGRWPIAVVSLDGRNDLVVTRRQDDPFDDNDLEALRAVAALLRQAPAPPAALAGLPDLAGRLLSSTSVDEVLAAVVGAVAELAQAEIAGVMLCDPEGTSSCAGWSATGRSRAPACGPGRARG